MSTYFTDYVAGDKINHTNYNRGLGEIDSAITDKLDGTESQTGVVVGSGSLNASAVLEEDSTSGGHTFPSMTTAQKEAIPSPLAGLIVYDTTLGALCYYNGTSWLTFGSPSISPQVVDSGTFSGVSTFTISSLPSTFQEFTLRLTAALDASTASAKLYFRFNADTNTNYHHNSRYNGASGDTGMTASAGIFRFMDDKSSNAAEIQCEYTLRIRNANSTSRVKFCHMIGLAVQSSSENVEVIRGGMLWDKSPLEAISSITVVQANGTNMSGKWKVYGRL